MPLKTLVKVGSITNLSDARYCAGMGVDMLGFGVIEGRPNYLSPALYQQMRGWISGPKIVAECYGLTDVRKLEQILKEYAPDYIEVSSDELPFVKGNTSLPLIVYIRSAEEVNNVTGAEYFLIDDHLNNLPSNSARVILKINNRANAEQMLGKEQVGGFALQGSAEIRPGFKNYDELADILEFLEE